MKILDRYIGGTVARGYLLVLLVLLTVFSFLTLVDEMENIGKGRFRLWDAGVAVGLMVPRHIVELLPVTALLGSILALGGLASRHELVAMQAVGVSASRIAWAVIKTGAVLVVAAMLLDEFVIPPFEQLNHAHHALTKTQKGFQWTEHGFWARNDHRMIHVQTLLHGRIPEDIDIYRFDEKGHLRVFIHARQGRLRQPHQWILTDVDQKIIKDSNIVTHHVPQLTWESFLTPEQIELLLLPAESLSPSDLYEYIQYLQESRQNSDHYELAFWKKVSMPMATAAMVLIAIPFVFGPLRTAGMGWRMMAGSFVGLAFHLTSKIVGHLGLLFSIHPAVTTLAPVVSLLGVAIWLLRRAT